MTKRIKPSDFAKAVITLRGQPLSFENYLPFVDVYDQYPDTLVIRAGRQVGKSVSLSASLISMSILTEYINSLYIAPLSQQASRFGTSYLDPMLSTNLIRKHFRDNSHKKNVLLKQFNTGSNIYLGYAETESDSNRVRGINGDILTIDEAQDISIDALPVLFEILSASPYNYKRITGTSKNVNGTLETYWKKTNQCYWCWKCIHCGKHIVPFDFETCLKILKGKEGPACPHCGKDSPNVQEGKWYAFNPSVKDKIGFHMPQLIMGARTTHNKWEEMKAKVDIYTPTKLANEVLGLPSGIGGRILSYNECLACCNPEKHYFDERRPMPENDRRGIGTIILGVDWSVTNAQKSFTVVSVLGYDFSGKCYLLYAEKMSGTDILVQVDRVRQLYTQFDAQAIGSDRGCGVLQINLLQRDFGPERVFAINYVSAKTHLRWDSQGQYFAADRTQAMDTMIMKIKYGRDKFESPAWKVMAPFYEDALNVFEEESKTGKRLYRHEEDSPDDWIHSVTFGNIAHMILAGDYYYIDSPEDNQ